MQLRPKPRPLQLAVIILNTITAMQSGHTHCLLGSHVFLRQCAMDMNLVLFIRNITFNNEPHFEFQFVISETRTFEKHDSQRIK